ncbi:tetratricopeptide repeat protein [Myxococcus llanfairpwllgwyngyllgogerychwyrndrobwllllantysiliogogogochensis]|uniref:tetratricopeptide repeat protein n=1 Tax=Myxococcus llanfairpwllgwyngyllgogerychwyrndrobwllllantysiliogogogochensis TaxID=2590453 RepID=UPI001FE28803|nr:tetratricopeptide repeat protein [Myxococcus llanfairpwllgwyngyllgogerychwyrndrobwllllantysiliogogogochensis]
MTKRDDQETQPPEPLPGKTSGEGSTTPSHGQREDEGAARDAAASGKSAKQRRNRREVDESDAPDVPGAGERNGREPCPPEVAQKLRELDRLRRSGRYTTALALARSLAEAHPKLGRVLLELAMTLGIWGSAPAEALPWFERVLELAPGHRTTRLHRALCLARLGRHVEAVADFDALVDGGYRKALVLHMKRAESLEALGRDAEAEQDWTLALAEDADNPWLLQQRAAVRARLGRSAEAIQDLTAALALQQGEGIDPELLHERGLLRARLGEVDGARADFQAGLDALRRGDPSTLPDALRSALQALTAT